MATCNAGCSCTTEFYDPVCDEQGTKYFSSCHAGCAEISEDGEVSHVNIMPLGKLTHAMKRFFSCKNLKIY